MLLYVAICICGRLNVIHTCVFDSESCIFNLAAVISITARGLSLGAEGRAPLLGGVCGPLTVVASLVLGLSLQVHGLQ